jgi:hypothetical protein
MDLSGRRCRMTVADPDLDQFIAEHLPPEMRPRGRDGEILGPDDESDPASGQKVFLEHVGRMYVLSESEFDLLDEK